MSLSDAEILELLQLVTRLTLHYESVIAREKDIERPYTLSPAGARKALRRLQELLRKDGRGVSLPFGDLPYLDDQMVREFLAQALDVVRSRYDLQELVDTQLAAIPWNAGPTEGK